MIDLHVHSSFSDGTDTPEELARAAAASGVTALALTDHDNVAGVPDFLAACRREGIVGIAGVEISAHVQQGTLHVLGLGVDPASAALDDALARVRDGREERNHRIVGKLHELGFGLTWGEVQELAGHDVVGRPHIARAMIAHGWAGGVEEVFDRYLGEGAPAYVDRFKLSPEESVKLVVEAGGVPVVAHPLSWLADLGELETALAKLKAAGLAGVEVYHSSHNLGDEVELMRLSSRLGLLPSGGTDYHGEDVKPGIRIGTGPGRMEVPDAILAPLLKRMCPQGYVDLAEGRA